MRSIAIVLTIFLASNLPESHAIEFYPISTPDSTYVDGTTLMSLTSYSNGTPLDKLVQGSQTVSFSSILVKSNVEPGNWDTWGTPPATESSNPEILIHENMSALELSLSLASKTFGFELQGADFTQANFLVTFYQDTNVVGTLEQTVDGNSGALLFAGYTLNQSFTRVVIENPSANSGGWAIENIRYATTAVPEPSTYLLGAIATIACGAIARRKRAKTA